jgi:predicted dehydrogenase
MTVAGAAVIGCGVLGRKRAEALTARGVPVRAVYDLQPAAAEALNLSLPSHPVVATSPEQAVRTEGVDLVVVAVVHAALAPCAHVAVEAGRPVLVEKPGAATYGEIRHLESAAAEAQVTVRVGFNHRFHPALVHARELVAGGQYGRVMNVRGRYGHGGRVGYEREWRADKRLSGGGELIDQGVHLIDLTRFLVGDVELAFSELRTDFWDMAVEDNAFLALRGKSGAFAWLHASWTEWKNIFSLEIALAHAKIDIAGLGGSYGTERLALHRMRAELGPPDTTIWEWPRADGSLEAELEDVLAELAGAPAFGADLHDAAEVLRIVEGAYSA